MTSHHPPRPLLPARTRHALAACTALLLGATATACADPAGERTAASRTPAATSATPATGGTASRAAPAASASPRGERGFTLVATGDVLPHDSIIRRARADAVGEGYDFAPMLAGVRPVISGADVAVCHMETIYGAEGDYSGYPAFKSPPEVAAGLRATGYDSCSTASNHTLDDGVEGVTRTLDALDRAGVKHAGSARTEREARTPAWLTGGTAKVAHLAYTFGTNVNPLPEDMQWAVNPMEPELITRDARAARAAGADVVVVSLHWGTEWQEEPDEDQLAVGEQLTALRTGDRPDIDLIIGTHAHVPQAYEKVNGTWIVYGMGDQIAGDMMNYDGEWDARGNEGSIARFTFRPPVRSGARWEVDKAEFLPQWFDTGRGRVVDLTTSQVTDGTEPAEVRERVRETVLSRGAAKDGLTMAR
ncbi:CapA family protein [Streptomyces sp. NPDC059578]|uniref:CapA family protein n=1 Tax=Streptomyces sp. NPDC059578 TaxID=3346874 RepID=UPI0036ACD648